MAERGLVSAPVSAPAGNQPRCLVIGIGTRGHGDDGAGALVLDLLGQDTDRAGQLWRRDITLLTHPGPPLDLLEHLSGVNTLYLVDACRGGGDAGNRYRFDLASGPLPARRFGLSSHGLDLAATLELARALGSLPPNTVLYAIEAASFAPGPPCPAVTAGAAAVARALRLELGVEPDRAAPVSAYQGR
ncbi:MAG: hydrogenase maturation protease [Chromatiaceae bacterium]|nr:MAG: hydrogenase maturation protease [Chromatiaceae bacterium]